MRPTHYYNPLDWGPLKPTSILGYKMLSVKCAERFKIETGDGSRSHCVVRLLEHYDADGYPLTPDLPNRLLDWGRHYPITLYMPQLLLRKVSKKFKYQTGQDSRSLLICTLQEAYVQGKISFARVERS